MVQHLARATVVLAFIAWVGPAAFAASAPAITLCSCCEAQQDAACAAPCTGLSQGGECPVTVVFDSSPPGDANQLNGISLKELDLGSPTRQQLEQFRKFLETARRRALEDYRQALRDFKRHRITRAELDEAKRRHDEVMVNYNHGIFAYRVAAGTREE
jgi:Spy/CpxP family protein refolding chaperone